MPSGIYIHIPFCASRCHYCNFATGRFESGVAERYVSAIRKEISVGTYPGTEVDTVYFGGGTPTTLSISQLQSILDSCVGRYRLTSNAEITIEANPGTFEPKYLKSLRSIGFNRISLGIQSFDDAELAMIDRTHNSSEALRSINAVREAGFENLSVDLIAGLPDQTLDTWRRNLEILFGLGTEHFSVYLLELYKDAPLAHRIARGELREIPEERFIEMYDLLLDISEEAGFRHYEISNWAKPGFESRHNLKYWRGENYLAFGVSAAGFDGMRRWSNTRNINDYLSLVESDVSPIAEDLALSEDELQSERIFLGLRLDEGVDLVEHKARFGIDILERYSSEIARLSEAGLIEFDGNKMRIARRGKILANEVFQAFV